MQIHEVTLPLTEGILQTIGQDIKGAVGGALDKGSAVLSTPGALTTARGYGAALDQAEQAQAAKYQQQYQQQKAQYLAQQTQQKAKQLAQQWAQYVASKPKPPARLKSTPTPIKPTGQYATKPAPGTVVNMEPGAVAVREVEEPIKIGDQPIDPKDPKYAQLISKLPRRPATVTAPPTGFSGQNYTQDPVTKQWYKIGTAPPTGGSVKPQDTRSIMTGARAQEFKDWANKQLTSQITGTDRTISLKDVTGNLQDPTSQKLAQLLPAIIMNNDATAVEQYFTIAMQAMQKLAAEKRASQGVSGTARSSTGSELLSQYVPPRQLQDLKQLAKNPQALAQIKRELGIR
jgi:hypothetical protein